MDITPASATCTLLDGQPMHIIHHGQQMTVSLSDPVVRPIPAALAGLRHRSSHRDASQPGGSPHRPPGLPAGISSAATCGDRNANRTLHTIAISPLRYHPPAIACATRRAAGGGDQPGFLAQGGIACQRVRAGLGAAPAGKAVTDGDDRASRGESGAHLLISGQRSRGPSRPSVIFSPG